MKISSASFSLPLVEVEQAARILATIGIRYMDVGTFLKVGNTTIKSNLPIGDIMERPEWVADRLKRISDENGIGFSDLFRQGMDFFDGAPNHPDARVRQDNQVWFSALVNLCKLVGFPGITLLPGMPWPELGPEGSFDLACQELAKFAAIANDQGLRLSVEPHIGSIIEQPALALRMVQQTPGLQYTLDYSHFIVKGSPIEPIHALIPYAGHFHARQCAPGILQSIMSEGTVDFRDIVGRLHAAGYKGFLAVEYVWADWEGCNRVDALAETIQLRDQLQEILTSLRAYEE